MTPKTHIATWMLGALSLVTAGLIAQPQTVPSTTQIAPAEIKATITGVEGKVQVRNSESEPWKTATVGMVVGEGGEFRTGPRSSVRCEIPPDQTITLDRLGTFKLLQAIKDGKVIKTKVGMQYGQIRYDIEEAGLEHQSELVSPSSTLAIRGTRVSITDQPPFAPSAVSLTGRAVYTTAKRQIAFGNKGQGKTEVDSDNDSAAAAAVLQTYVDPNTKFGRTPTDQKLINQLQSKGDVVLNNGQLALAFGGPVTDKQLQSLLASQGRFNISLRWDGPGDFDLFVLTTDPTGQNPDGFTLGNPSYRGSVFKDIGFFGGEGVAPVTASQTPDGGRIKFDQIAFGGGGVELASWNTPVPQLGFTVAIVYYDQRGKLAAYPVRSKFRVDAFLDGKALPTLTNFDELVLGTATELKFGPTYTGTASLIDSEKILVVDHAQLNGDIRVTAVDISPEALGLDGKPIGIINPPTGQETATVRIAGTEKSKGVTKSTKTAAAPTKTTPAPVKAVSGKTKGARGK